MMIIGCDFHTRYQFMDKIGNQAVKNPYVMIRLDRLTGAVDAFNWARRVI